MPSGKESKRRRRAILSNEPQNRTEQEMVATYREVVSSDPIPDPDVLERYKNADPSFPERIMKMAEEHNAADVVTKNRISLSNLVIPIIGQVFTLILGVAGILACVYLAKAGYTGPAIAAIVGSFSPIIIGALKGLRYRE